MACDPATLERLRHTAKTGKGPTAVWARKRLIEIDPEWAVANINLADLAPVPAVPATPAAASTNYQADGNLDALARALAKQISAYFTELSQEGTDQVEERVKGWLQQWEAKDIPS